MGHPEFVAPQRGEWSLGEVSTAAVVEAAAIILGNVVVAIAIVEADVVVKVALIVATGVVAGV